MKNLLRIPVFALLLGFFLMLPASAKEVTIPAVQEGDILFQISDWSQSQAIQLGTGSEWTHCGIVLKKDGKLQVFEAVAKTGWTPLEKWIRRGVKGRYVLMRLKDPSVLTPEVLKAMRADTATFAGKDYDWLFQWSDTRVYCSELVWKLYKRNAGLELGALRTFAEYDLDHEAIRKIIKERYGDSFNPNEKVIAPSDIMNSSLLEVISGN